MPNLNERLLIYFQEISKDGAISSWYLAQKFGYTKRRLQKDLGQAKKLELVLYTSCRLCSLKVNLTLTEKGLEYMKGGIAA